jgi:hypothetical protein
MYVIHEQLARIYAEQRRAEARHERRVSRLRAARRAELRAEAAAAKARRLRAIAVAG